eukprot:4851304-Prymnesium_polylepis.1
MSPGETASRVSRRQSETGQISRPGRTNPADKVERTTVHSCTRMAQMAQACAHCTASVRTRMRLLFRFKRRLPRGPFDGADSNGSNLSSDAL